MKNPILLLGALFALFIFAGCVLPWQNQGNNSNTTNTTHEYKIYGDPSEFFSALGGSDNFSVVMDFRNSISENSNQTVIVCSAGLITSWTGLGKNITNLRIYALEDNNCILSNPFLNETLNFTDLECQSRYVAGPYVYVMYGNPESYFSNSSWKVIVDKEYVEKSECGFSISGQ